MEHNLIMTIIINIKTSKIKITSKYKFNRKHTNKPPKKVIKKKINLTIEINRFIRKVNN